MSPDTASPDVRIFADARAASEQGAAWVAGELTASASRRGRASFVLCGGSTPRTLYQLLGTQFKDAVPWARVDVFWGDERYVPSDHSLSNYRMAKLPLLDRIDLPAGQVHPMPTDFPDPEMAARAYEATLAGYFSDAPPVFDVMLLGIGEDGHTASVFAGSPAIAATRSVMAVTVPAEPTTRLTLTLPVIARSRRIGVLVTGASKAPALAAALAGNSDCPAGVLMKTASHTIWWVDVPAYPPADRGAAR